MKICVLIDAWDPVWGGGQTHVWEIANWLVKSGINIDIFTRALREGNYSHNQGREIFVKGSLRVIRVGFVSEFNNALGRLNWLIMVVREVWKYHQNDPYDLIHAHAFLPAIPGKVLQLLLSKPLIFTVHGSPLMDAYPKSFGAKLERWILTGIKFDREISVSRQFLKYPNVNRDIAVIPNGVDLELFTAKTAYHLHPSVSFLWVGRFDAIKGVPILLAAFAKAIKVNKKLRLTLVGFGFEKKTYEPLAQKLNLAKSVQFIGKKTRKQLANLYRSSDLFVLPSLAEGQPITLLEAMASGVPVIATQVGDNAEIVKEGINGWLVSPGDIDALAKALLIAGKSHKLQIMGQHGRQVMETRFNWESSAIATKKIYLSLLLRIRS